MSRVLVVEDSPTQAKQIEFFLADANYEVELAVNGVAALSAIERQPPDIVLTDLQMPEMNGLALVQAIRSRYPFLPVVLMTSHGSDEIAAQALQQGAASYFPKRKFVRDLISTLEKIIAMAKAEHGHHRALECLTEMQSRFVLGNDPSLAPPLVARLTHDLRQMKFGDETGVIRVGVALEEALENAIMHGNLELGNELQELSQLAYRELAAKRRGQRPYADRRVHVTARVSSGEAVYVVRDEGRGFDRAALSEPKAPVDLDSTGRGLALIRTFMDDVQFNDTGNEITMIKRRDATGEYTR